MPAWTGAPSNGPLGLRLWPTGAAALLYLILPGHPSTWLNGLPLGPAGLTILIGLGLFLFACWPLKQAPRPSTWVIVFLLALGLLKAVMLSVTPAYGLVASYFGKPGSAASAERSTEFPWLEATRLDRQLSFSDNSFPLYFFNDNLRFNYYRADEPDRETLPFSVRWRGYVRLSEATTGRIWLTTVGLARLALSDLTIEVDSERRANSGASEFSLPVGFHPLEVIYARRGGTPALLRVEWDVGQGRTVLSTPSLLVEPRAEPVPPAALLLGSQLLDLAFLGALVVAAWQLRRFASTSVERRWLAVLVLAVYGYGLISSLPLRDRVTLLDGGADWLTYETYARDIQLSGPLMTLGRAPGKGRPFFFQPFYPYALAGMHWLSGEDLAGVITLQFLGIGVTTVLVYYLGCRLRGRLTGCLAMLLVVGLLGPLHLDWIARHLLSENIYFWLLPATALALVDLTRRPTGRLALGGGLLLGLSCVTRGPTLAWAPFAIGAAFVPLRRRFGQRRALWTVGLVALTLLLVVGLVPLRNYLVSGQPALLATNGMATMELAHPVPPTVDLSNADRNPVYRALKLDFSVIQMIEFIRQDPQGYLATLLPLGLYALGLPAALEPGSAPRWELLGLMTLYGFYITRRWWQRGTEETTSDLTAAMLHIFIAIHLLVMVTFLPNNYGYRQVLPMYLFVAIFAAQVLARGALGLRRPAAQEKDRGDQHSTVEQSVPRARTSSGHEQLT